jgi:prepilin-type N-terminal cleavage/methylation domain-containing protein
MARKGAKTLTAISVMFPQFKPLSGGKNRGFTMVELLVTLVLLGLIASIAAPGLESWLRSRQASAMRMALSNELALLPLQANRNGNAITISSANQLHTTDLQLEFIEPVVVLANGYCQGGQVALKQGRHQVVYDIIAPFCQLRRNEAL